MTAEINQPNASTSSFKPSLWVVRKDGIILSYHKKSGQAVKWLDSHTGAFTGRSMVVAMELGYKVTKSYTAVARFVHPKDPTQRVEPEWVGEFEAFDVAMNALNGWVHRSWEQDRDNHPSPAGRTQVWERWHDVSALIHLSELTLIPNPAFAYDFGPLSPPEGKGWLLRLSVFPTGERTLQAIARHDV
jgi:hypothetical protein